MPETDYRETGMPDLSEAEREAMGSALRAEIDASYERELSDAKHIFEAGWLAARDYYEKRHIEQQATTLEALREVEARERAVREALTLAAGDLERAFAVIEAGRPDVVLTWAENARAAVAASPQSDHERPVERPS